MTTGLKLSHTGKSKEIKTILGRENKIKSMNRYNEAKEEEIRARIAILAKQQEANVLAWPLAALMICGLEFYLGLLAMEDQFFNLLGQ